MSKFEVEKESNARYIADLQATNASLSDEIKRDRKLLETAVSDVIREQNAAAARDHDLRIELDGYVDQARLQAHKLEGIKDACSHYKAWNNLVALRRRIASSAPLLGASGGRYTDWLNESSTYISDGLQVPDGCDA